MVTTTTTTTTITTTTTTTSQPHAVLTEFANCGLDGWQRDIDRVEGGVDIRFPRRRSSAIARWIRDEFGHEPAAGRILESTQLLVSVLSPTLGRERRFKCGRGSHVATKRRKARS